MGLILSQGVIWQKSLVVMVIAASLAQEGMIVSVVESDPICAMQADGFACYKKRLFFLKQIDLSWEI